MRPRIAIFGGSFDPPGLHHRQVAEELSKHFDRIIVVPCGPRPDMESIADVDPVFRAALTDIAFADLPKVEVDLFDLEHAIFTRTDGLEERYGGMGDCWHIVGADLVAGGSEGAAIVQRVWDRGEELWHTLRFAVVVRPGFPALEADLPPQSERFELEHPSTEASATIREKIFKREPYAHLVPAAVVDYIERYGLYRGRIPSRATHWTMEKPRLLIVADERNPRSAEWARRFAEFRDNENPNCVLVLGGDGTMLHAIRTHWRRRVPFLGINAGHLGFLLNDSATILSGDFPPADLTVRQMPLIYVSVRSSDGTEQQALAFNDAWLERSTSQSAWLEVKVNGDTRIPKLVADGVLLSTAAGSTAYARSMGASPLLADTPSWLMVGSNVMDPPGWKSALLPSEATIELLSIGEAKRPVEAFVDGRSCGKVNSLFARMSRIATAELAFCSLQDMAEKIARIQFPAEHR
jgi:NAD kinase